MWEDDSGKGKLYSLSYILSYLDKLLLFCCKLQEDTLGQNPTFKLCAPRFILTRLTNQMKLPILVAHAWTCESTYKEHANLSAISEWQ